MTGAPDHPPRPPIPIAGVDERAADLVRERLGRLAPHTGGLGRLGELAAWLAAVTGTDRPDVRPHAVVAAADQAGAPRDDTLAELRALAAGERAAAVLARLLDVRLRLVDAGVVGDATAQAVLATGLPPSRDPRREPALTTEDTALAVDAGRALAAEAARDRATVITARATGTAAPVAATSLAALLTGHQPPGRDDVAEALALNREQARGPLGALRRVGGGAIAVVCGVALGAGEHGLGLLCDGLAALAGGAVAVAVEPDLRPRLLAAEGSPERTHVALLEHLGLEPVLAAGTGASGGAAAATLALLRLAAAVAGD